MSIGKWPREEEKALKTVIVDLQGQRLEFTLDSDTHKWALVDASARGLLHEGEFPLIAFAGGKRYELYSDGTFGEVEL
ncbi:MAG: hypothetical protein WAK11_14330 [Candidatus Cybelea sp.]